VISAFNLLGAIFAAGAMLLLFTPWRQRLAQEEACIAILVTSVTVLVNAQGFWYWVGRTASEVPEENLGDFLQILQPALWGVFFYVVVQSAQRRELIKSQVLAWNHFAEQTTGYSKEEVVHAPDALKRLFPAQQIQDQILQECNNQGASYSHRVWPVMCKQRYERQIAWYNISKKFPIPDWSNWGIGLDITELLASQRDLEHKATHDELTSLPNRALLRDRLTHALSDCQRNQQAGALLMLDLDHFKIVNDTHGHPVGDRLLYEIGERLRGCLKSTDTLARFGGDEFVVLLEKIQRAEEAAMVAERIISEITSRPFYLYGQEIRVSTSIGITVFPDDDVRIDELIKNVDLALYAAKENGRNGYHYYSRAMHNKLRWQHKVSNKKNSRCGGAIALGRYARDTLIARRIYSYCREYGVDASTW